MPPSLEHRSDVLCLFDQVCMIAVLDSPRPVSAWGVAARVGGHDVVTQAITVNRLAALVEAGCLEVVGDSTPRLDRSSWVRATSDGVTTLLRSMTGSPLAAAITESVPDGPLGRDPAPVVLGQGDFRQHIDLKA